MTKRIATSRAGKARELSPAFVAKQWKPGESGNPSGHTAEYGEVVRLAREFAIPATLRLGELIQSRDERVAIMAANAMLDRGFGRPPPQPPQKAERDEMAARLSKMTPEQREEDARQLVARIREQLYGPDSHNGEVIDVETHEIPSDDDHKPE